MVNYSRNKALLENVPHIRFLDLAITFHCLVRQDDSGIGTIRLTNEHKEMWDLSMKDLMQIASINTERLFPARITTMEQVLAELFRKELESEKDDEQELPFTDVGEDNWMEETNESQQNEYTEEMLDAMLNDMRLAKQTPTMYILTNTAGINGATTMIYKDVIRNFAKEHDTDFYILPSSIHEVILVPYEERISKEELKDMVGEVNCTQVALEEVLSDRVYIYRRDTNMIEI